MTGGLMTYILVINFGPSILALRGSEETALLSSIGTWVGAIGTIGTLMGAIWIANSEARSKRRDNLDLAIIHAANFQHRVQSLVIAVDLCITTLKKEEHGLVLHDHAKQAIAILDSLVKFSAEEIALLVPLKHDCALRLAHIQSAIGNATAHLKRLKFALVTQEHGMPLAGLNVEFVELPLGVLIEQRDRLWNVLSIITAATSFYDEV
jgi:hypothetical protein